MSESRYVRKRREALQRSYAGVLYLAAADATAKVAAEDAEDTGISITLANLVDSKVSKKEFAELILSLAARLATAEAKADMVTTLAAKVQDLEQRVEDLETP